MQSLTRCPLCQHRYQVEASEHPLHVVGTQGWKPNSELSTIGIVLAGRPAHALEEASARLLCRTVHGASGMLPGLVDRFSIALARVRRVLPVDSLGWSYRQSFIRP